MQKDEAVHLHALLREIRRHAEARGWVRPDGFTEYDQLGISPLQIHRPKGRHEQALLVLASLLGRELSDDLEDVPDEQGAERQAEVASSPEER